MLKVVAATSSADYHCPKVEGGGQNWSKKDKEQFLMVGKDQICLLLSCTGGRGKGDE
jgi:hypothetical protein